MTVYGSKDSDDWFDDPNGAKFIGNELRRCNYIGFFLRWDAPVGVPVGTCMGDNGWHVITGWGDELTEGEGEVIAVNPTTVWVTDSDQSTVTTGSEQYDYDWDDLNKRWHIDYMDTIPDPYFWNVVTLSPHDPDCAYSAVGSYKVKNDQDPANDMHYKAGAYDADRICKYTTELDVATSDTPRIVKYQLDEGCLGGHPTCEYIEVDWEFPPGEEVPKDTEVTITTEFLLPNDNVISYENVYFTKDSVPGAVFPPFGWTMRTPTVETYMGGGYVVGAFELYSDPAGQNLLGQYRFQHEYWYNENPDSHYFSLHSLDSLSALYVGDLRFGHSCDLLSTVDLWDKSDWLITQPGVVTIPTLGEYPMSLGWSVTPCIPPSSVPAPSIALALDQNYPNPFNASTVIGFSIDREEWVVLSVHDVAGRLVRTLANRPFTAGGHTATWHGRDMHEVDVPSGIYFYRLEAGGRSLNRKALLLR